MFQLCTCEMLHTAAAAHPLPQSLSHSLVFFDSGHHLPLGHLSAVKSSREAWRWGENGFSRYRLPLVHLIANSPSTAERWRSTCIRSPIMTLHRSWRSTDSCGFTEQFSAPRLHERNLQRVNDNELGGSPDAPPLSSLANILTASQPRRFEYHTGSRLKNVRVR